jgi:uncharacterized protein YndB with AHSA1/START domain
MSQDSTCALCGYRFSEQECLVTCSRCALFGAGGCHKVRCPRCGYEMPAPPRLPGLLAHFARRVIGKNEAKDVMHNAPIVIEQLLQASPMRVWRAITDNEQMKRWYFNIAEFQAEVGFAFSFVAGTEGKQYRHICQVTEVVVGEKLSYSWRYQDYPGTSFVTFALASEGDHTRLTLTHSGIETFPPDDPNFTRDSFLQGWTHIIGTSLREFMDAESR